MAEIGERKDGVGIETQAREAGGDIRVRDILWIVLWDIPCVLMLYGGIGGLLWYGWHGAWGKAVVCLLANGIAAAIDKKLDKLRSGVDSD